MPYRNPTFSILIVITVTVAGFFLGLNLHGISDDCTHTYMHINNDAVCRKQIITKTAYTETQREVATYISAAQLTGKASEVSVYFRDLHDGPVFGLDELAEFIPASLLKLPLAFIYFSVEEVQPGILSERIRYTGESNNITQEYIPKETGKVGEEYTIEELLHLMLAFSDNNSQELLSRFVENASQEVNVREEIFKELGLTDPQSVVEETLSVRGYASLFRLLYNASFLTAEQSEKILTWLTESDFYDGIVAGVPEGTVVAHKFGERSIAGTDMRQLHDCGIVYYPENPYLICIMTEGDDWNELAKVIADISRIVYTEVDSRRI